jgi:hypothetical protein
MSKTSRPRGSKDSQQRARSKQQSSLSYFKHETVFVREEEEEEEKEKADHALTRLLF